MEHIFGSDAVSNMIQFSKNDKIDVVIFSSSVEKISTTLNGEQVYEFVEKLKTVDPGGTTALFPAVVDSLSILVGEDSDEYNLSVIVMTDGVGNVGSYSDLKSYYKTLTQEIPVYSITFGDASEDQLKSIANLTNGKVFDGKSDLVKAFKMVRGYN